MIPAEKNHSTSTDPPPLQPAWYDHGWLAYLLDWTYPLKRRVLCAFGLGCILGAMALPLSAVQHGIDLSAIDLASILEGQATAEILSILLPGAFFPLLLSGVAAGSAHAEWLRFGNRLEEEVGVEPDCRHSPEAHIRYKRLEGVPFSVNLVTMSIGLLTITALYSWYLYSIFLATLVIWAYFGWRLERHSRAERKHLSETYATGRDHE